MGSKIQKAKKLNNRPIKEDTDYIESVLGEDIQTPEREREMKKKINRHDMLADKGEIQAERGKSDKERFKGRSLWLKNHHAGINLRNYDDREKKDNTKVYGKGGKVKQSTDNRPISTDNRPIKEDTDYIEMLEATIIALAEHFECEPTDLIESVLGEDFQTPERDREMKKRIAKHERLAKKDKPR